MASIPGMESDSIGVDLPTIPGQIPDPAARPSGCPFHPRCSEALAHCDESEPQLYNLSLDHGSACYLHDSTPGESHATG